MHNHGNIADAILDLCKECDLPAPALMGFAKNDALYTNDGWYAVVRSLQVTRSHTLAVPSALADSRNGRLASPCAGGLCLGENCMS